MPRASEPLLVHDRGEKNANRDLYTLTTPLSQLLRLPTLRAGSRRPRRAAPRRASPIPNNRSRCHQDVDFCARSPVPHRPARSPVPHRPARAGADRGRPRAARTRAPLGDPKGAPAAAARRAARTNTHSLRLAPAAAAVAAVGEAGATPERPCHAAAPATPSRQLAAATPLLPAARDRSPARCARACLLRSTHLSAQATRWVRRAQQPCSSACVLHDTEHAWNGGGRRDQAGRCLPTGAAVSIVL